MVNYKKEIKKTERGIERKEEKLAKLKKHLEDLKELERTKGRNH